MMPGMPGQDPYTYPQINMLTEIISDEIRHGEAADKLGNFL
jgi:hypothetical protein